MDQLIKSISEKAGISAEQAQTAIAQVMAFVKDKMPAGLGSHLDGLMGGTGGESGGMPSLGDLAGKLSGLMGGGKSEAK